MPSELKYHGQQIVGRVIGGSSLKRPLPYQLQLDHRGSHRCGATLISSKHAISADHCFRDRYGNSLGKKWLSNILVRSGALYNNGIGSETRKIKMIVRPNQKWKRHSDGSWGFFPDLIILELESPFTLIEGVVQPACLPSKVRTA